VAKLIYSAIASLDGYVADAEGRFDWSVPDEEVHAFVNDQERPIGTYLYGRRLYEVMRAWESADGPDFAAPLMQDYAALWQAAEKVVFSTTLDAVSTARTRLERTFEPDAVRRMKAESESDIGIGGPGLAAHALAAGLVDECNLLISPVVVGGGTAWLPDGLRLRLELLDERRFGNGVVHLHYRTSGEPV
jgi:dihydrofolate reductase